MASKDQMRPATPSVKFTYDDLVNFPDDGRRHEVIDGEHYVTPSPDIRHQRIVHQLDRALGNYLQTQPVGVVFPAPLDVRFSDLDVVQPDLLYVSRERAGTLAGNRVDGSPDLVIEVLSPSTRRTDEVTKRKLYERFDVREYWIVDPDLEAVKVYCRSETGAFERTAELSSERGDTLTSPLLPGFSVPLAVVFAPPL